MRHRVEDPCFSCNERRPFRFPRKVQYQKLRKDIRIIKASRSQYMKARIYVPLNFLANLFEANKIKLKIKFSTNPVKIMYSQT